ASGKREVVDGPTNLNTDRIEYLFNRGKINKRQQEAARRFQGDWQASKIMPCGSASMVRVSGGGSPGTLTDKKLDAQKRHDSAVLALGRWLKVVESVVIGNMTIEQTAKYMHVHPER